MKDFVSQTKKLDFILKAIWAQSTWGPQDNCSSVYLTQCFLMYQTPVIKRGIISIISVLLLRQPSKIHTGYQKRILWAFGRASA